MRQKVNKSKHPHLVFALDLTSIPAKPTGIGMYSLNLAKHLHQLIQSKDVSRFCVLVQQDSALRGELDDVEKIIVPPMGKLKRVLWECFSLPKIVKHNNISLIHSPNYSTPIGVSCAKVTTIHDLTSFLFPKRRKKIHAFYSRTMMLITSIFADTIISVSKNTSDDVLKYLPVRKKNPIVTIYQGKNEIFRPIEGGISRLIKEKYSCIRPYFLFVSTVETSKNIDLLSEVFIRFSKESSDHPELLVVGKKGWGCKKFWDLLEREDGKNAIRYLGYVPDADLVQLYNGARSLIYPSLYEGFGIPPLEAMSCGTPVIASNISSIPEVVGEAAILIDPYSTEDILFALEKIQSDESLRLTLSRSGIIQAANFTWDKSAAEHYQVYMETVYKHKKGMKQ